VSPILARATDTPCRTDVRGRRRRLLPEGRHAAARRPHPVARRRAGPGRVHLGSRMGLRPGQVKDMPEEAIANESAIRCQRRSTTRPIGGQRRSAGTTGTCPGWPGCCGLRWPFGWACWSSTSYPRSLSDPPPARLRSVMQSGSSAKTRSAAHCITTWSGLATTPVPGGWASTAVLAATQELGSLCESD